MMAGKTINPYKLMLSFSDTIDLAMPILKHHQQRTAFIALEMAKMAGLSAEMQKGAFAAAVFHDIGALKVEEKLSLHENIESNLKTHCQRGRSLFLTNEWLAPYSEAVFHHHTPFSELGKPITDPEALLAQILFLADYIERSITRDVFILHQDAIIKGKLESLSGKAVAPDVVDLFFKMAEREEFWFDLTSPHLTRILMEKAPREVVDLNNRTLKIFAELVSRIVDFKSPFTFAHSTGVANCCRSLGKFAGMTDDDAALLGIAGNLHDLGKLAIPNSILDKQGPLSPDEMAKMKQHTYTTNALLSSVDELKTLSEWAAHHHERIDGKGYPFRKRGEEISRGSRIVAVSDIFTALSEDRPYRAGMDREKALGILRTETRNGAWDPEIVEILADNIATIHHDIKSGFETIGEDYRANYANGM